MQGLEKFIISLSPRPYAVRMFRLRSIDHIRGKIKAWASLMDRKDVYAICTVVFVGISGFFLGQLSMIEANRQPVTIERFALEEPPPIAAKVESKTIPKQKNEPLEAPFAQTTSVAASKGLYVGSKSSNKYHLPSCSSAQKIAEANKVWFTTKSEAEKAGYVPAGTCKGI